MLLTQHLLENFHKFFYFKILPVTVFAVAKGKSDRSLRENENVLGFLYKIIIRKNQVLENYLQERVFAKKN